MHKKKIETNRGIVYLSIMDNIQYIKTRELLRVFGLSRSKLANLLKDGIPRVKLGPKAYRFRVDEVAAWLKARDEAENKGGER